MLIETVYGVYAIHAQGSDFSLIGIYSRKTDADKKIASLLKLATKGKSCGLHYICETAVPMSMETAADQLIAERLSKLNMKPISDAFFKSIQDGGWYQEKPNNGEGSD